MRLDCHRPQCTNISMSLDVAASPTRRSARRRTSGPSPSPSGSVSISRATPVTPEADHREHRRLAAVLVTFSLIVARSDLPPATGPRPGTEQLTSDSVGVYWVIGLLMGGNRFSLIRWGLRSFRRPRWELPVQVTEGRTTSAHRTAPDGRHLILSRTGDALPFT